MTLKNLLLATLFVLCAFWLCSSQPIQAVPTNCDAVCRMRQHFYMPSEMAKYRKYREATCEFCWTNPLNTATTTCQVKAGEENTDLFCFTLAGKEQANEWWEITTKSACNFLPNHKSIEANPADPDPMAKSVKAGITECKDVK
ncbi:MAG: hypothetical protein L0241_23585 [Planctomycetia bacterium]|nr:hypothetical protein [Planctomycetia bacterium]